VKEHRIIS